MTSEMITAIGSVIGIGITAWFSGRVFLKRTINKGDNGFERRSDSITKIEHIECKKNRVETENRLFNGQDKLENKIEAARLEVKSDINKIYEKQDQIRIEIGNKIDTLNERIK